MRACVSVCVCVCVCVCVWRRGVCVRNRGGGWGVGGNRGHRTRLLPVFALIERVTVIKHTAFFSLAPQYL